jgi:Uri superfamily endonuclease
MKGIPAEKGTYILFLRMKADRILRVGRLGELTFRRGVHAYIGSALGPGGLAARIGHHLRVTGRLHWHLDYLRPFAEPAVLWYAESQVRFEHEWASLLASSFAESTPAPGFGCSDCRCPSHLLHFPRIPAMRDFLRRLPRRNRSAFRLSEIRIADERVAP